MAYSKVNPRLNVQHLKLSENGLKLKCPFAMTCSGPSQVGKSYFISQIVKFRQDICTENFERIIYCNSNCYAHKNQLFIKSLQEHFPKLEVHQGIPNLNELQLTFNNIPTLLLIDDLMDEILNSINMVRLVTSEVHNFNISVVFTLQNYFANGKYGRTLIRNCHYRVFFYNQVEQLELRNISSQIANAPNFFAANFQFLQRKFPMEKSHYLLIDGHSQSENMGLFCRTHIFPPFPKGTVTPIIFFPNPDFKKEKK